MTRSLPPYLAACAALLLGCGADPQVPPASAVAHDQPSMTATAAPATDLQPDNQTSGVNIDKRIAEMCSLPTAHFDFDSAAVGEPAKKMLDALAKCFLDGPAKGKGMRLVGHTDTRGPDEYNLGLGQRRAAAVASHLTRAGLGPERVATSSRGEIEATGTDEAGWAQDRRVEIVLAE